ncbi:MAG: gliding motility-associated C-terminal domain-containing protein [Bacteroidota bacterium]|nr:gliding motility-associated C-terminal domain-containing protein [Bacteroidota bacterium]
MSVGQGNALYKLIGRWPLLWAFLCVAFSAEAVILDPPSLRCASVNITGDVTLTWVVPADPGGDFQEYRIYSAGAFAGPYVQVGTVPAAATTTFFHAFAGADAGPRFYYVTTVSTSPPPNESVPSDTLSTLYLEVDQSAPLGNAVLSWDPASILPTTSTDINIWMEYPLGNWTQIANVPATSTSYSHEVSVCEDSLTFRIGLSDQLGCISFSSRDGAIFEDATPPSPPVLNSVSVDSLSGLANISWAPSPEGDTDGYILVLITPGGGVIIDTVYGYLNNTYEWPWSTPASEVESFTVAAFDTCQVGDPPSPNTSATLPAHTTMLLGTSYDRCAGTITLEWSPYIGWPVTAYQILVQMNDGAWAPLTNVPGSITSYTYDVQPGEYYCFFVKALQGPGGNFSLSSKACLFAEFPSTPQFNYIRTVTVTAPKQIMIVDSVDMNAEVGLYTLERSDNGGDWEAITTMPGDAGPVITFVDEDVEPELIGYRYRVQVQDSCGGQSITSNIGGNIVLRATPDLHNFNTLEWNAYAQWAGTPVQYIIHRGIHNDPLEPIAAVPPQPLVFADDVKDMLETTGKFCYMIQAVEGGNPSGINSTSESNVQCAIQEELVYIPNAFVVGGVNRLFIPVIGYVDVSQYEFSIINRWGQLIWTTTDRELGWDGTVGSNVMPTGIYGYYCTFHNGAGRRFEKRGIVTLLTALAE